MPKSKRKKLPETFAGARVVRGLGMRAEAYDALVETHAFAEFSDARGRDVYLVIEDAALDDGVFMELRLFADYDKALRCARAQASGNMNQRVLKVTEQTLVVGTESDSLT